MEQQVSETQPVQQTQTANPAEVQKPKGGNKLPLIIIIVLLIAIIIGGGIFAFTQLNNQNNNKEEDKTQEESKDDSKKEEGEEFTKEDAKEFVSKIAEEFNILQEKLDMTSERLGDLDSDASESEIIEYLENLEQVFSDNVTFLEEAKENLSDITENKDAKKVVQSVINAYDTVIDYYKDYLVVSNRLKEGQSTYEEFVLESQLFIEERTGEMKNVIDEMYEAAEEFAKLFNIDFNQSNLMEEELPNKTEIDDRSDNNDSSNLDEDYEFSDEDLEELLKELEQYQN